MKLSFSRPLVLVMVVLFACGDSGGDTDAASESASGTSESAGTTAGSPIDEDAIVQDVLNFDGGGFTKVNLQPVGSQHQPVLVDIWVQSDAAAKYFMIDPPTYSTDVTFDVGTTLIKRHYSDAELTPDGWTVMHKGPEGYAPDTADWWWARVLEDGTIQASGKDESDVSICIGCHQVSPKTDWVLGIDPMDHDNP